MGRGRKGALQSAVASGSALEEAESPQTGPLKDAREGGAAGPELKRQVPLVPTGAGWQSRDRRRVVPPHCSRAPESSGCLAQNLLSRPPFYQLNPSVRARGQRAARKSVHVTVDWGCFCLFCHLVPSADDLMIRGQERGCGPAWKNSRQHVCASACHPPRLVHQPGLDSRKPSCHSQPASLLGPQWRGAPSAAAVAFPLDLSSLTPETALLGL